MKQYSREDLTVVWKPDMCRHSTRCWKGLIEVFNPKSSPWINMNGAEKERIKQQVMQCPSGALSFEEKQPANGDNSATEETIS